jgi:hypothetical protein
MICEGSGGEEAIKKDTMINASLFHKLLENQMSVNKMEM